MKKLSKTEKENRLLVLKIAEELDVELYEFQHAWRINGVIDLFKKMKTVQDLNSGEYHKFKTAEEGIEFAFEFIIDIDRKPTFKKTDTGGMTYQEFKHLNP